jgi:hypothetical protein
MASPRPPSLTQALHDRLPELRGLQVAVLQSQVQGNVPCLNAEVDKMSPSDVVKASRALAKPSACG